MLTSKYSLLNRKGYIMEILGPKDANKFIRTFFNIGKCTYKAGEFVYKTIQTASDRANNHKIFDQLNINEKRDLILDCLNKKMSLTQICKNFNLSENEVSGFVLKNNIKVIRKLPKTIHIVKKS